MNSIINKEDATHNPESKMSPCMKRLVKTYNWKDSFRILHPEAKTYSRYYNHDRTGLDASKIDRCYHWGDLTVKDAKYTSLAFSDNLGMIVCFTLPDQIAKIQSPNSRPSFRARPEVVLDKQFRRSLLLVRQAYLTRNIQTGLLTRLGELKTVHLLIEEWYDQECAKIALQSRVDDIQKSEKIRIYHHEIHQKLIKKSCILKLDSEIGILEGHTACATYLENSVADLLLHPATLDSRVPAQCSVRYSQSLLRLTTRCFVHLLQRMR